jgi:predicted amidohydrolase YtcJ
MPQPGFADRAGFADRVITNARMITMTSEHRVTAMAFGGGRILAMGSDADIEVFVVPGTVVEDMHGATVLPGLIDAHNHLLMTGQILQQIQLYDCRSIDQILERLRVVVAQSPPGAWILGRGWDESLLAEQRHPTRHDLDRVAPNHPVVLHRVWNRLVANSRAIERAGISRETPDPPADQPYAGGFERDSDGDPTGLFRDRAKELITAHVPKPTHGELVSAIQTACQEYNRLGITAVSEPGLSPEQIRAFHEAALQGVLTVRTAMSISGWGFGAQSEDALIRDRLAGIGVMGGFGDDLLWIDGVKLMPDGGVGDRTARMYEPYVGEPTNRGTWTVPPDELIDHIQWTHEHGYAMDIHTCGDEAQDVAILAFARAQETAPNPRLRHRVHHAYLPTETALTAMAKHKIPAVVSNPFLWSLGESYRISIGDERAARMMPMRTYLDRGVPLAGSSDSPVATHNPWIGMASAITRTTVQGTVLGADERLTPDEALAMYLTGGAFVLNRQAAIGRIAPGTMADLVVLDADPRSLPPDALMNVEPRATMLGGEWVHDIR